MVSNALQLILVLVALFYLSWLVTVIALVLIPMFLIPARLVGRRLQRLTRESMQLDADDGLDHDRAVQRRRRDAGEAVRPPAGGVERCSPSGRPRSGTSAWSQSMYGSSLFIALTLLASLVHRGRLRGRRRPGHPAAPSSSARWSPWPCCSTGLYGPITALSNVQVNVMTALVSFRPGVRGARPEAADRGPAGRGTARACGARQRPAAAPSRDIIFDHVSFRYPAGQRGLSGVAGVDRAARARADGRDGRACCTT